MNADDVDLRQLRALVALAREGTFTDAAIRLGSSQPAVSRAIARLEASIGLRLVERTTRTLALTAAGTQLAEDARTLLSDLDAALERAHGRTRPLRLGYAWAAFGPYTTDVLRSWRRQHPDRPVEVHRVDERGAGLTHRDTDLAVIRGPVNDPDWHAEVLFEEGRMAAVPAGHALAERDTVTIRDVTGTVAITPSVGTTTVELWPADAQPTDTVEVGNIDEWLTEIASGMAVGVTPASTAVINTHPGVVYIPVEDVGPVAVNLVRPKVGAHPWTADFVAHAHRRIEADRARNLDKDPSPAPDPG